MKIDEELDLNLQVYINFRAHENLLSIHKLNDEMKCYKLDGTCYQTRRFEIIQ